MNSISYQWNLRKIQRQRVKTLSAYKKARGKAKSEGKPQYEIEELVHEELFEIRLIDDEIESLESGYLIERAQKLILPIPEFSDSDGSWKQSEMNRRYRLSKKAMVDLRSAVRRDNNCTGRIIPAGICTRYDKEYCFDYLSLPLNSFVSPSRRLCVYVRWLTIDPDIQRQV